MIYVFLANGFEETEAIAPIDIMRRSGLDVVTVGIDGNTIKSSHGVTVITDITDKDVKLDGGLEGIVLPGGMPGTLNLEKSATVQNAIDYCTANDLYIGAICAAPQILGHKGLLKGKKATCYTGFEDQLEGAEVVSAPAVRDGKIITSWGAGGAIDFGLMLSEAFCSAEKRQKMAEAIRWNRD